MITLLMFLGTIYYSIRSVILQWFYQFLVHISLSFDVQCSFTCTAMFCILSLIFCCFLSHIKVAVSLLQVPFGWVKYVLLQFLFTVYFSYKYIAFCLVYSSVIYLGSVIPICRASWTFLKNLAYFLWDLYWPCIVIAIKSPS